MQMTKGVTNQKLMLVVYNGLVMALYLALSILVAPFASGAIQFRISECLNHVVVFNRKLMWGVVGGVVVFNTFFGYGVIDALYGGGGTLLALTCTALLQKYVKNIKVRLVLNTVFFSASMFLIALMLTQNGEGGFWALYGPLALSEAIVMGISAPIMYVVNKSLRFDERV